MLRETRLNQLEKTVTEGSKLGEEGGTLFAHLGTKITSQQRVLAEARPRQAGGTVIRYNVNRKLNFYCTNNNVDYSDRVTSFPFCFENKH